jgi:hypothetical protein
MLFTKTSAGNSQRDKPRRARAPNRRRSQSMHRDPSFDPLSARSDPCRKSAWQCQVPQRQLHGEEPHDPRCHRPHHVIIRSSTAASPKQRPPKSRSRRMRCAVIQTFPSRLRSFLVIINTVIPLTIGRRVAANMRPPIILASVLSTASSRETTAA